MAPEVITIDELNLSKSAPGWLSQTALATRTLLMQGLPYQQREGALTQHDPQGGVVLVKVLRKEADTEHLYAKLAELANEPDGLFDFAVGWQDAYEAPNSSAAQLYGYFAVCKARAVARTGLAMGELLDLHKTGESRFEAENLVTVDFNTDGSVKFPDQRVFGDFPSKGVVIVEDEEHLVLVSCSGFSQEEDEWAAISAAEYVLVRLKSPIEVPA